MRIISQEVMNISIPNLGGLQQCVCLCVCNSMFHVGLILFTLTPVAAIPVAISSRKRSTKQTFSSTAPFWFVLATFTSILSGFRKESSHGTSQETCVLALSGMAGLDAYIVSIHLRIGGHHL